MSKHEGMPRCAAVDAFIASSEPPRPGTVAVFVAGGGLAIVDDSDGTRLHAMDGARLFAGRAVDWWQGGDNGALTLETDDGREREDYPPAQCYVDRADCIRAQALCCAATQKDAIVSALACIGCRVVSVPGAVADDVIASADPDELLRALAEVLR